MNVDSPVTLLDKLRESGLLESAQLAELARLPESRDPDPHALARVLLQRGLLSRFQINLVAQGKAKELRIGPFLLLDKLGEGGMGQVFKARHLRMGRIVALKLMRKEKLANADAIKRFYQEVQAASQLNHPNIVIAYDADQVGNLHYFSMEYIEGFDLARQVKQHGPLPVALACEYARQAALGLQHAHEKGLIHRDIKPHNLLVAQSGAAAVVKILDMGLARLQGQGETGLTQVGQVLGTPDYLAPEQAFDSRKADIRSDVYSLGCTLYFLLTGRPPFTGETLTAVLLKHQMEEAIALARLRPEVSPALVAVVRKMMAKQPGDRYQTPVEVAEALAPFARGEEVAYHEARMPVARPVVEDDTNDTWATLAGDEDKVVARPGSSRSRSTTRVVEDDTPRRGRKRQQEQRRKKFNPTMLYALVGAGVAVPLLGLLVLGIVLLSGSSKPPEGKGDPEEQVTVGPGPKKPGPKNPSGPKVEPASMAAIFDAVEEAVRANKVARTGGAPPRPAGKEDFEDVLPEGGLLTGLEVGVYAPGHGGEFAQAFRPIYQTRKRGRVLGKQIGPVFPRVVTVEAKPGYAIGALSVRAGIGLDAVTVTFMAIEGRKLNPSKSYTSDQYGGQGGNGPYLLGGDGTPAVGIFGKMLGQHAGQIGLVTISDGKVQPIEPQPSPQPGVYRLVRTYGGHDRNVLGVVYSPAGTQFLSQDSKAVRLFEFGPGTARRTFAGHTKKINGMSVSSDFSRLVTCGEDGLVLLWDVKSGAQLKKLPGHKGPVLCVAISPDGKYAASAGE
jgi:serine/threonine protein kinase